MGIRPKTARRLALIGALAGIVVVGGGAVLTVPGWQRARQIESFKRNGLEAHRDGNHQEAVRMLNRHTSAVGEENVEPVVLLSLARSQAESEARRDNHFNVAITRYLAYLRLEPDDLAARRELLSTYVKAQRWGEAVDLAERINAFAAPSDATEFQAARDEWNARRRLDPEDERLLALEEMLLTAGAPSFKDAWAIYNFRARLSGDVYQPFGSMRRYAEASPGSPGARIVEIIEPPAPDSELGDAEQRELFGRSVEDIKAFLGLDGDAGTPGLVALDEEGLAQAVAGILDSVALPAFAAEVLSQSLSGEQASENRDQLARRLYWLGAYEPLAAIDVPDGDEARSIDTLGYQALAANREQDEERTNALQRELESVSFSYKAKSWLDALAADRALMEGDLPAARAAAKSAVERYETEPTFRLLYANAHSRMGFVSEALAQWDAATRAAGSIPWDEPVANRVLALFQDDRRQEARALLREFFVQDRFAGSFALRRLSLRIDSTMFLQGLISVPEAVNAAARGEAIHVEVSRVMGEGVDLADIDLSLARIYGRLGENEEATRVLSRVIASPHAARYFADVRRIDERFGLGLAAAGGQPALPESIQDPVAAFQIALTYCESVGRSGAPGFEARVDESAAWLGAMAGSAPEDDRAAWLFARARFIEATRPEDASPLWRAAMEADPENLELLREVVWAQELGSDLSFVDQAIEQIRQLTLSQGRTLPAYLRLARAKAIIGDRPNRAQRDQALGIIRSVVAAEPQNTRARNMLGNLLAAESAPIHTEPEDRFDADIDGAIDQFQSIAAAIPGNGAAPYYIRIMELADRAGDSDRSQRAVRDLLETVRADAETMRAIAGSMRNAGEGDTAARLIESYFIEAAGPERVLSGLVLAETYTVLRRDDDAKRVLSELAVSAGFDAAQLSDLAIRLQQNGMTDQVESLFENARRGGMDAGIINAARAELLARFAPIDEALAGLDTIARADPGNPEVWRVLVRTLIEAQRLEIAKDRIDEALAANPGDRTLELYEARLSGDLDVLVGRTLADLEAFGGRRDSQVALEAIRDFELRRESLDRDQALDELRSLTDRFSRLGAAVSYTLTERDALGEDMSTLVADATSAARSFPDQPSILRVATKASIAMGEHESGAEFALAWRALAEGSRREPDLYAAEAFQSMGLDDRAIALTEPYVADAIENPREPLNQAALTLHGSSMMRAGRGSEVRALFAPPASIDPGFRATVWVRLGSRWSIDEEMAFDWLDAAEGWGSEGIELVIAQGWADAARRFEARRVEMLTRALRMAERAQERDRSDLEAVMTRAGVLRALGIVDLGSEGGWNRRAEEAYLEADRIAPENLNFLFQAARSAEDDGRHPDAERHYRSMLQRPNCTGDFAAGVRNNAAMAIVRQLESDPGRLADAAGFIGAAIETRSSPAFLSTRGWVRYLSGDLDGAAGDFRARVQSDPGNAASWAGLALSERGPDASPTEASREAWGRALQFGLDEGFIVQLAARAGLTSE